MVMNYIVLEGISLYMFLALVILLVLISIASLIIAISADNRNSILAKLLTDEQRKVKLLLKANFKLKLKHGELDCDDKKNI